MLKCKTCKGVPEKRVFNSFEFMYCTTCREEVTTDGNSPEKEDMIDGYPAWVNNPPDVPKKRTSSFKTGPGYFIYPPYLVPPKGGTYG